MSKDTESRKYVVNPATLERIKSALDRLPKDWPDLMCDGCSRVMEVEVLELRCDRPMKPKAPRVWRVASMERLEKDWFSGSFDGAGGRVSYCPECATKNIIL